MKQNILKKKIMRRVYTIYLLKKIINPFAFKVYALAISVTGVVSLVSVTDILANIPNLGSSSIFNFSYNAFVNTEITVQALVISLTMFMLWLIADGVRNILNNQTPVQVYS